MLTTIPTPKVNEKVMKSLADATIRKNLFLTEEGVAVLLSMSINESRQK